MKSMMTLVTAGSLIAALATAQSQVPFKGTMQGQDTDTCFSFPTVCVTTSGTGIATLVGQFSFTLQNTVNLVAQTSAGFATWIAANGDSITATVVGSAEPSATPGFISITEIYTITGGTGRFAGAQGSFTSERLASLATKLTSGSFYGTITSPGAPH